MFARAGVAFPLMNRMRDRLARDLPYPVVLAAAWAACAVLIAGAAWVAGTVVGKLLIVIIPLAVAVLFSAMLSPLARFLRRTLRFPSALAALASVFVLLGVFVGGFALATERLAVGFGQLRQGAREGIDQVMAWLRTGPLHLSIDPGTDVTAGIRDWAGQSSGALASGALSIGATAVDVIAGMLICLLSLFFFLHQGDRIWRFCLRFVPRGARAEFHEAMRRGWVSLGNYSRTQIGVAAINAAGIGIGAWIMGIPLVIPSTILVFLASFVPIVGAIVSGAVVVLIAMVDKGAMAALIMLAIVVGVHFLETHVLQPFLMGHAVSIHPLAVIVVVAAGTYLFGLAGALFAVPLTALLNSSIGYAMGNDPFPALVDGGPGAGGETAGEAAVEPDGHRPRASS